MTIEEYLNKKKRFEFYILNINKSQANYEEIITLFSDSIANPLVVEEDDCTIILSTVINSDINQLVNAIVSDFGIKLKIFKSNSILVTNLSYLNDLKTLVFKYKRYLNKSFNTIKDLALAVIDRDKKDVQILKPIILNKIYSDNKMHEIVKGMFINNLNVCKTANYVYMHRNTINNKLSILKEETGLDIQQFQDAVILYEYLKK